MKIYKCLVCISIILSILLGQASVLAVSDYGNMNGVEYGDAVYRFLDAWSLGSLANYNHAGLFAGIDGMDSYRVLHAANLADCVQDASLIEQFVNIPPYYGAYTHSERDLVFTDRKAIIKTARDLADASVYYTIWNAIDPLTSARPITVSNIDNIRCDGIVEYCYESQNIWVWYPGNASWQWNILYYPEAHNDMPSIFTLNPDIELSPWAQRGAPTNTGPWYYPGPNPNNSYLKPAVIDIPTCEIQSWPSNDHIVVQVKARDIKSGIHVIYYKLPGEQEWKFSTNGQHPESDTFTQQYEVHQEGLFYYLAVDNGGNLPEDAESVYIEFPVTVPPTFTLNSPSNGSMVVGTPITFSWNASSGATNYHLQISTDSEFNTKIHDSDVGDVVSVDLTAFPNDNTRLYWRVKAGNSAGWSEYSSGWNFYNGKPKKTFNPLPSKGSVNQPGHINVSWSEGDGATSYLVYFGTDSILDSGDYKGEQAATSYDPGALAYSTPYYWRIDAKNSAGITAGDTWSFTVKDSPLSVQKCTTAAGKSRGMDSLSFSGILKASEVDLLNANNIVVSIHAEDATQPLNFAFPINTATLKKGKFSGKNSNSSFGLDTKTGKMAFSAKNVNLTGMACPITVTITIGSYSAQAGLSEAIVNGAKPCPIQFMMGIQNTLTATKATVKHGKNPNTDSLTILGTFTIAGSCSKSNPLVLTLGSQIFTVPGVQFVNAKGVESCKKAVSTGGAIVDAKFDFVKCTYTISVKNATIAQSGNAAFGINCFGNSLEGLTTVNLY